MSTESHLSWLIGRITPESFSIIRAIQDPTPNELIASGAAVMVIVGAVIVVGLL